MKSLESEFIFNSPLETGIRAICILSVDSSLKLDLQQLVALDHLIVHTGDFKDGPESLHPKVKSRAGELMVRRKLIERGLMLMEYKGLVSRLHLNNGFFYRSTDLSHVFIDSMTNNYIKKLQERAEWAVDMLYRNEYNTFKIIFDTAIKSWSNEFKLLDIKSIKENRDNL